MDCLELREEPECSREPENYKFTGSEEIDGDAYLFWYEADMVKSSNSCQTSEEDVDVFVGSGMCKEPSDYLNNYYSNGIIFYNIKGKKYLGFSYPYVCATYTEKIVHNLIINTKNIHHARHW